MFHIMEYGSGLYFRTNNTIVLLYHSCFGCVVVMDRSEVILFDDAGYGDLRVGCVLRVLVERVLVERVIGVVVLVFFE